MCSHFSLRIEKHCKCEVEMNGFLCRQRAWRNFWGRGYMTSWHSSVRRHEFASAKRIRWDRKWICVFLGAPWHLPPIYKAHDHRWQQKHLPRNFCCKQFMADEIGWKHFHEALLFLYCLLRWISLFHLGNWTLSQPSKFFEQNLFWVCEMQYFARKELEWETNFGRKGDHMGMVNACVCSAECSVCQEKTRFVLHIYIPTYCASLRCWQVS